MGQNSNPDLISPGLCLVHALLSKAGLIKSGLRSWHAVAPDIRHLTGGVLSCLPLLVRLWPLGHMDDAGTGSHEPNHVLPGSHEGMSAVSEFIMLSSSIPANVFKDRREASAAADNQSVGSGEEVVGSDESDDFFSDDDADSQHLSPATPHTHRGYDKLSRARIAKMGEERWIEMSAKAGDVVEDHLTAHLFRDDQKQAALTFTQSVQKQAGSQTSSSQSDSQADKAQSTAGGTAANASSDTAAASSARSNFSHKSKMPFIGVSKTAGTVPPITCESLHFLMVKPTVQDLEECMRCDNYKGASDTTLFGEKAIHHRQVTSAFYVCKCDMLAFAAHRYAPATDSLKDADKYIQVAMARDANCPDPFRAFLAFLNTRPHTACGYLLLIQKPSSQTQLVQRSWRTHPKAVQVHDDLCPTLLENVSGHAKHLRSIRDEYKAQAKAQSDSKVKASVSFGLDPTDSDAIVTMYAPHRCVPSETAPRSRWSDTPANSFVRFTSHPHQVQCTSGTCAFLDYGTRCNCM